MTRHTTSADADLHERIISLDGLPPFPAAASQILAECEKPNVDVQTVAKLVECEPAICSKVIRLANSPLYGAPRPIFAINHAIVLLGFTAVSQMAISIAAGTLFQAGDPQFANHRKQAFRQSLACAITGRMLAIKVGALNPDEAFLCGVMHDVGKLVLLEVAPEQYSEILTGTSSDDTTGAEQLAFGIDHASIGKRCGTKWGFPAQINLAIEHHHRELNATPQELSRLVMAANYYSRSWGTAGESNIIQPVVPEIDNAFNVENLASMKDECSDQFEAVLEICGA